MYIYIYIYIYLYLYKHILLYVGDGMTPAGLIEGWIVTEEMSLEKLNRETSKSVLLKMLKSDFFLDLTENTFKYAK
jgi:hypothetical protein